ncbi:MAG TPA: hypothetical protein VFQ54_08920 [Thermomicrobiales bacterium]|nr:hypothetical protein [Thermomicrobiales bacterium]
MVDAELRMLRNTAHSARKRLDRLDRDLSRFAHRAPRIVDPRSIRRRETSAATRGFMIGAAVSGAVALFLSRARTVLAPARSTVARLTSGVGGGWTVAHSSLDRPVRSEADAAYLNLAEASIDSGAMAHTDVAAHTVEDGGVESRDA